MARNDITIPAIAKQHQLEFLFELYNDGVQLDQVSIDKLKAAGYVTEKLDVASSFTTQSGSLERSKKYKERMIIPKKLPSDKYINIDLSSDFRATAVAVGSDIRKEDWMPKSLIYHDPGFVRWIDSINEGFDNRVTYKPFELYKQQADEWYAQNIDVMEEGDPHRQYDLMLMELNRCSENSMYALNKYYYYQDTHNPAGKSKFYMTEFYDHQRIICFLYDCGYSMLIGKPRQFGGTTLLGCLAVNRLMNHSNYFIKFITEDDKKGKEIFEDKIKFAFYSLDHWYVPQTNGKPDVLNDRDNLFKLGRKEAKGKTVGLNSKMVVIPPARTAINGGTPPLVLIDEIGSIDILSEMINEGRPTMFRRDPVTGKMELKNQVVGWGTGTTAKGGAALEKEFRKALAAWKAGDYSYGFIPLFFDWSTRCDEEEYLKQKRYYYGARSVDEGVDAETSKIQFHQHYPSNIEDMFATTKKTLIGREVIDAAVNKINSLPETRKCIYGYFDPIYDLSKPIDNPHVPYKIIGADFISCEEEDPRVTTVIFQHPKTGWVYRYWAGTDPIASDTGISNQSTSIFDKYYNTLSALTNFRIQNDPAYSFLQSALLCLYYDTSLSKIGVPELIEKNIGLAYRQFKENVGLAANLMYSSELPASLRGDSVSIGVDNKGSRNRVIINYMAELFTTFAGNIYIPDYWTQHRTFVCSVTRSGMEQWGSVDPRYYKDDALFGGVYAYIAAVSSYAIPKNIDAEPMVMSSRYKISYDKDFNLIRKPVVEHAEKSD